MTDRNDGRPRHSASHIHCAVSFFCARSGTEGEAGRRCGDGRRRCAGAGEGLRRGMGCEVGGKCIALRGGEKMLGEGVSLCGVGGGLRRGRVVGSARNASRSLRAGVGAAWGSGSAREGRVAVRGREQIFGGEWVVRSAGLTHFRRSRSRVRVLLYIRPPRHCREIAAMGSKRRSRECSSPAKTSAPAPSAFTLPRRRSYFPTKPSAAPTRQSAFR